MSIIAAKAADGRNIGFTSTSVISISLDPMLIAFSVMGKSSSWPVLETADRVSVSFLADGQEGIARRFSKQGIDRFAAGGWRLLPVGLPVIENAAASLSARIIQRIAAGGSHLVIASVETIALGAAAPAPLVYFDKQYRSIAVVPGPSQPLPEQSGPMEEEHS